MGRNPAGMMAGRPSRGSGLGRPAQPLGASGYAFNELPAGRDLAGLAPPGRSPGCHAASVVCQFLSTSQWKPCRGATCPGLFPFPSAALSPVADPAGIELGRVRRRAALEDTGRKSREHSADHLAERLPRHVSAHTRIPSIVAEPAFAARRVGFRPRRHLARRPFVTDNDGRSVPRCRKSTAKTIRAIGRKIT